ncbi:uncharacterized protein LY89DRAFT_237178 [Mollisia scopiformis]|uniref:Uncharacterized protein n=1 Tax=Mollisia scopiformis TaxID=149040 RepID=A0A194WTU6_MOLSC|nr:uncharacterized protein LY89DRAFT_237178 [Mollisia scopiformis]KUJ11114.1 hypothetical protein LY89DRAFT_237178 [Mollisia scopiformis]
MWKHLEMMLISVLLVLLDFGSRVWTHPLPEINCDQTLVLTKSQSSVRSTQIDHIAANLQDGIVACNLAVKDDGFSVNLATKDKAQELFYHLEKFISKTTGRYTETECHCDTGNADKVFRRAPQRLPHEDLEMPDVDTSDTGYPEDNQSDNSSSTGSSTGLAVWAWVCIGIYSVGGAVILGVLIWYCFWHEAEGAGSAYEENTGSEL